MSRRVEVLCVHTATAIAAVSCMGQSDVYFSVCGTSPLPHMLAACSLLLSAKHGG